MPFPVYREQAPRHLGLADHRPRRPDAIDGYADQQSVLPGQTFRLYVSTTANSFRVKAFCFGWY